MIDQQQFMFSSKRMLLDHSCSLLISCFCLCSPMLTVWTCSVSFHPGHRVTLSKADVHHVVC